MKNILFFLMIILIQFPDPALAQPKRIQWETWSDTIFARSKKENKLVILDLEAIWCHWCHVMDEKTYSDPRIIDLISSKYIAVRVDQDSRPDLSNKYENYGWPATVLFSPTGQELAIRSGFVEPDKMLSLLQAFVDDPTPGPSVESPKEIKYATSPLVSDSLRKNLVELMMKSYDFRLGSWKTNNKLMDSNFVEYLIVKSQLGDRQAKSMAQQTLKAQQNLIDPAWGGVYQYSVGGNWKEPHFEKIMSMQADNLKIYSQAYGVWGDKKYLKSAQAIEGFLSHFLKSPDGAFYTSQDADLIEGEHSDKYFKLNDENRRKQGIPKVDEHLYARENGWAIEALVTLYSVTGDAKYLDEAVKAAHWIVAHRSIEGGGFSHGELGSGENMGPYLGDSVSMGKASLALYMATGDRPWLKTASDTLHFISQHFAGSTAGFLTTSPNKNSTFEAKPHFDENFAVARFSNLMFYYTGNEDFKKMSQSAMRFLTTPEIAEEIFSIGPVLLLDHEISRPPVHITVIGHKDDLRAQELNKAALRYPSFYKRVDWWDKREGDFPNADVKYPELSSPAAFACAEERCSLPAFKPEEIKKRVDSLLGK